MARRAFPPSSCDERRVKKREKKMRGGGRDPDESGRRGGVEGVFSCFVSCSSVGIEIRSCAQHLFNIIPKKVEQIKP